MAFGKDGNQPIGRNGSGLELLVIDGAFDKAEIGEPFARRGGDLLRVAGSDVQRDAWIARAKTRGDGRQPVIGDRLARIDRQRTALEAGEIFQRALGRRCTRQNRSRLGKKCRARLRQLDRARRGRTA